MADDSSNDWSLYPYKPNQGAPIAFAIILTILAIGQLYLSFFKYRWRYFGSVMTWASLVWIAGFVCRSISIRNVQDIGIYISQTVLILLGPPLYSAAEYWILSRLLSYLPYHAPIHPGRVLSTFIILSTVVESLTASGAANSAGADRDASQRKTGLDLLKAALIIQCFVEAFFFSLVALLEYRCRRVKQFPRNIRTVCYILYTTSLMILVRCIVRTVEGFETASCGPDHPYCGTVTRNEWFLWTFEVANITLFVVLLLIFHPGKYLPTASEVYLDPIDGKTERVGPGFSKADKRPFWITVIDPFNLNGILTGKGMVVDKFWERHQPIHTK